MQETEPVNGQPRPPVISVAATPATERINMPTAEPSDKVQSQPIELTLDALQTPCLLLDEARVRANVGRMRSHLTHLGVAFRPHLKTAKSLDVARIAMTTPEGP